MPRAAAIVLTSALLATGFVGRAGAEQGAATTHVRYSGGPAAAKPAPRDPWAESDLIRPYGGGGAAEGRVYKSRTTPPARTPVVERTAANSRGVRDYFPGMRPGVGPNQNVGTVRSHCVPGRHFLMGR
jgi:hypothetical protein